MKKKVQQSRVRKRPGTSSAPRKTILATLTRERTALCVDSNYEEVTAACCAYRESNVYPYLGGKGFVLIRCQGGLARRIYVALEAVKDNVRYITGVGHGSPDTFTGNYGEVIFSCGKYSDKEANGKIVHLISCETAQLLGPEFVANGCRAYFGYDENFAFQMDTIDVFMECDSEIDRGFANGLNAGEVYTSAINLFNKYISQLRASGEDYKAATLEFDRDHLKCPSSDSRWGDPSVSL